MVVSVLATSVAIPTIAMNVAYADNIQLANIEYRNITGNNVNFRTGPSTSTSSIGKLNKGDKVEYIATEGSWVKVKFSGKTGYVHSDYVSKSDSSNSNSGTVVSTKVVTGSSVNFRTGPGTSYSKISTLTKGTEVGFISQSGGWSKISYNGKVGYMSSDYLGDKSTGGGSSTDSDNTVKSTKVVTGGSVNFRTGPGTNYSKISTLTKGTEVGFISESGGWSKISHNGKVGYMTSQYLGEKGSVGIPSGNKADQVIEFAKKQLGKPYVWGAEGPNSFDCSGFTQYVLKQSAGVSLPRVSREQAKFGQYVNKSQLVKGDLVFFDTDGANNGVVTHAGIYMGNGQVINASSGSGKVIISDLNSSYYSSRFVNGRRVL